MERSLLEYYVKLRYELLISERIIQDAIIIHEKILETRFAQGKDPFLIATVCIYISSKSSEIPRTLKEVSFAGKIPRVNIARCYRLFLKNHDEIGFEIPSNRNIFDDK